MKLVRAILSFAFFTSLFILASNLMAGECDILPEHQGFECQGVFVVKNAKALTNYGKTLKIKMAKQKISLSILISTKNLLLLRHPVVFAFDQSIQ